MQRPKMASLFKGCCKVILLLWLFSSIQFLTVTSVEFEVGGDKGWIVPSSKDEEMYNDWASKNRFNVDDAVHFQYKKDSVLVVTEAEYQKCRSTQPIFFSNNGDTVVTLDRPGLFYFISGVSGHCERGQKMIIKVLEPETSASPPPPNGSSPDSTQTNGGVERNAFSYKVISMVFVLSIVVVNFT